MPLLTVLAHLEMKGKREKCIEIYKCINIQKYTATCIDLYILYKYTLFAYRHKHKTTRVSKGWDRNVPARWVPVGLAPNSPSSDFYHDSMHFSIGFTFLSHIPLFSGFFIFIFFFNLCHSRLSSRRPNFLCFLYTKMVNSTAAVCGYVQPLLCLSLMPHILEIYVEKHLVLECIKIYVI